MHEGIRITYEVVRRIAILAVGSTILVIGIVMIVTPGPAIVVIPVGLAILAMEFAWARMLLRKLREGISAQNARRRSRRAEHHRDRH